MTANQMYQMAFPLFVDEGEWYEGLTKIEYATIAAMQGILANPQINPMVTSPQDVAILARAAASHALERT